LGVQLSGRQILDQREERITDEQQGGNARNISHFTLPKNGVMGWDEVSQGKRQLRVDRDFLKATVEPNEAAASPTRRCQPLSPQTSFEEP
jgi:hypothetical protein